MFCPLLSVKSLSCLLLQIYWVLLQQAYPTSLSYLNRVHPQNLRENVISSDSILRSSLLFKTLSFVYIELVYVLSWNRMCDVLILIINAGLNAGFSPQIPDSNPDDLKWDTWWTKWYWSGFFFHFFGFPLLIIIIKLLHTYLSSPHGACEGLDRAALYHNLGPKSGASLCKIVFFWTLSIF
jgi:hypothetical protein